MTRIQIVTEPTIQLHRAASDQVSGPAVVIRPGGGYNILDFDKEGTEVADCTWPERCEDWLRLPGFIPIE